ncbi:Dynactin subunit 1 [Phytophthora citrophthora]|uniref:Dynactin subunit 1 n=1 Tax=Phytophthora citrophthora TaxID=4793 RepID=A0AAD9G4G5_9STRA|nr:Dynactin subunit 1 [Phytophthora citrophthora]
MASSIPRPRASITVAQGLSPVMKVPLGSRVVLSRRRNGTVRYVGKVVNESGEWYGVALDEPKGDNDGTKGKERYFYCPTNHGVFVRRKEIYTVKEPGSVLKGPPSPVTDDSSSCSSNVSTEQQEANGIIHPLPLCTDNAASPLMKTFKGFRKQLDFISLKTVGPGRSREASPIASPTSSSPSSPTGRSGLKPPSPFRRFSSFSQGLPIGERGSGSPTGKSVAASIDVRNKLSPPSPKPAPVRRVSSYVSPPDNCEAFTRPVEATVNRSSFRCPPIHIPTTEEGTQEVPNAIENECPATVEDTANDSFTLSFLDESDSLESNFLLKNDDTSPDQDLDLQNDRTSTFRVPPIDMSVLTAASVATTESPRCSPDAKSEHSPTNEKTNSFRRSSSFQVSGSQGSPSPENSPSRRSNSFAALSFDQIEAFDDISEDGQGSPRSLIPSPRDDITEASAVSAPEPDVAKSPLKSPRELTTVEPLSPDKKLTETNGKRPLFFRRTNIGRSPMERRSSYSSFSNFSSSPPKSPTASSLINAASQTSRVSELEKEISAMRSSHENIVAVLRATNKQHAANVLELRAQVAALTEGNLWLERQLTAKGELVRGLREMEKQQQRDTVSVGEVKKILELKDSQIQTLEREMAQLRQRLARLESDKDSQLYQQYQHYESRRERDEKRINSLRKEVVAMVRPCGRCERNSSN